MFCNRLGAEKKTYMTKREFLTRFWAAYTYEEIIDAKEAETQTEEEKQQYSLPAIMQSVSHNIIQANKKIQSELDQEEQKIKMFRAIQKKIRSVMPVQQAFTDMDNANQGYLSLRDFHLSFARLFDLAIKNDEIRALFSEIDTDENGIVTF